MKDNLHFEPLDYNAAPFAHVKGLLVSRFAYLRLVAVFSPGALANPTVKQTITDFSEWIEKASEVEVRQKTLILLKEFEKLIIASKTVAVPKISWDEIVHGYVELWKTKQCDWKIGLPYGWLDQAFECPGLTIPPDLPYHARIGIAHHAGEAAVEEEILLRDAFLMLVKTRRLFDRLKSEQARAKKNPNPKLAMKRLVALSHNVVAYARLAVYSFYAFVECFVNGVGEDFILRNPTLPADKALLLRGKKKDRYLPIERKLEMFPSIIRADGKTPIVISDPAQIGEPFKSFIGHTKELRDAATHYSKQKADIWRGPQEWVGLADSAMTTCIQVAREFWTACYPKRPQPVFLYDLNEKELLQLAEERWSAERSVSE